MTTSWVQNHSEVSFYLGVGIIDGRPRRRTSNRQMPSQRRLLKCKLQCLEVLDGHNNAMNLVHHTSRQR